MSTSEISEKDIRELQIRRKITATKTQRDEAWNKVYAVYKNTPEYKEYLRLKEAENALYQELDKVLEE